MFSENTVLMLKTSIKYALSFLTTVIVIVLILG